MDRTWVHISGKSLSRTFDKCLVPYSLIRWKWRISSSPCSEQSSSIPWRRSFLVGAMESLSSWLRILAVLSSMTRNLIDRAEAVNQKVYRSVPDQIASIDQLLTREFEKPLDVASFSALSPQVERWPSGRRRSPAKGVYLKRVSWVRIPSSPPFVSSQSNRRSGPLA